MATRKIMGTTIYPPLLVKNRIAEIADADGANWNYWAVKFLKAGLQRYERRQARREKKLQPNRG